MLWIALYIPELSLQLAQRNSEAEGPLVIAAGPDNRPTVQYANQPAIDAGINAGMTIASSRALVNDLHIVTRAPDAEVIAIHNVACWASQFTPSVSIKDAEGVLLEVATTLLLHGGLATLLGKLRTGCQALGYHTFGGVAPTPLAAWIFAKAKSHGYSVRTCQTIAGIEARIGDLPLALLDWPHDTLSKLSSLGIVRFADCLRLPPDGFSKRFTEGRWSDLQRILGKVPDPRLYFVVPEHYRAHADFGFEINDAMALLFPLRRLLSELEGFLRARGAGIHCYRIVLTHAGKLPPTEMVVRVANTERKADRLLSLAREHLSRLVLPGNVLALGLAVDRLEEFKEVSGSWLPDPNEQSDSWYQLLDKLTARLGPENVYRVQAVEDYRPEKAWKSVAANAPWKTYKPKDIGRPRPVFLLPIPRKLLSDQGVPLCHGKINLITGPERIECGWWDGMPELRDYYVGRNMHGETMWLYQDHRIPGIWHLHGYFS